MSPARTGGEILAANLVAQGATHAFCVPGESFLPLLDALYDVRDRLELVVCRHEGGAAFMAEACGKMTGRPGIAIVTRGPGASNAAIGIHTAAQDSTPLIVLVGQVGADFADREAFQEIDYRRMYGSIAKWVASIDRPERIPEYVARAYRVAMSGRPGPVVLALPEDMLELRAECADAPRVEPTPCAADPAQVAAVRRLLAGARSPLLLVGGSRWDAEAAAALARFAEANALPVACAFRNQDLFDNRHPQYAGDVGIGINPQLGRARARRRRAAGDRRAAGRDRSPRGYTLLEAPVPAQALIHVHPGGDELGRVYQPAVAIAATPGSFLAAMNAAPPVDAAAWRDAPAAAHADYVAWQAPRAGARRARPVAGVRWLDARLPDDAILANGAGNYATWLHRLYRYRGCRTQLAPYSGAMGYGVPAAVAAKALHPQRVVVGWNGDGCFQMNGQELAHGGPVRPRGRCSSSSTTACTGRSACTRSARTPRASTAPRSSTRISPRSPARTARTARRCRRTAEFAPAFERALARGQARAAARRAGSAGADDERVAGRAARGRARREQERDRPARYRARSPGGSTRRA